MVRIFYTRDVDYQSSSYRPTVDCIIMRITYMCTAKYASLVLIKYRSLWFLVVPCSSGIYAIRITFLPYRRANRVNVAFGREKYVMKLGDRIEEFPRSLSRNTGLMIMYRISSTAACLFVCPTSTPCSQ